MPSFAPPMAALEVTTHRTLFGLRFWDAATDRQVMHDLQVKAWPEALPSRVLAGVRTASGNYAFQGLPGLRALEAGEGDAPATRPFVVSVRDGARRFLDAAFTVDLPLSYAGLYLVDAPESVPGGNPPGVYLFTAPWRRPPPGFAVVYAQLVKWEGGAAAAFAVLELDVGGQTWVGMADEAGQVAVVLPWPQLEGDVVSSPPGGDLIPLTEQSWPVTARVRYQPSALSWPAGDLDIPDLASVLAQDAGRIWFDEAGPAGADAAYTLTYGQPLVLRTAALSELRIDTGA